MTYMPTDMEQNPPIAPGRLPLHLQISEMLVRDIQAGVLLDGERLPPEKEMAKNLGIAVGTLRKALTELVEKGLLERIHGSGNYIRHKVDVDSIYAFFRLELHAGGGLPSAEVLSVDKVMKPEDLPVFGSTTEGFRIRRLRRLNDLKVAVEEIWLDSAYAGDVKPADLSDSLYRFYNDDLNLRITRVEDKIGVSIAPRWAPSQFGLATSHYGFIQRLSWDQNGNSAEYSRTWFDPTRVCFVTRGR